MKCIWLWAVAGIQLLYHHDRSGRYTNFWSMQSNMAANVLILPGMTRQGAYSEYTRCYMYTAMQDVRYD